MPTLPCARELNILDRLKSATRAQHASAERQLDLFTRVDSLASYINLLQTFWGFFAPLEQSIAEVHGIRVVIPDFDERLRIHLIESDLNRLGFGPSMVSSLAICHELPPVRTLTEAVGTLYVIEGSTLGGQIIARHVRGLHPSIGDACSFFESHGQEVGPMWKRFGAAAQSYADAHPDQQDLICVAAQATFRRLESWLENV